MLDRLNLLANAVMFVGSGLFYLMLFSQAVPAFDAAKQFGKRSYWTVRIGLSFFVAGSLFGTLMMYEASLPQVIRNIGTAVLFAWATFYHAKKWGVVSKVRRHTGSYPVVK